MVVPTVLATIARSRWVRTVGLAMALADMRGQLPLHSPVNLLPVVNLTRRARPRWLSAHRSRPGRPVLSRARPVTRHAPGKAQVAVAGSARPGRPVVSRAGQLPEPRQVPAAPASSAWRTVAPSSASSNRDGAVRTSRCGMSSRAIMAITAQPTRYQLIQVLEPVALRIAAAISGAGPPAMTDASWYPSPAPL